MPIDSTIVVGLSTALGASVGGVISYLATRRQAYIDSLERAKERLERNYVDACKNIEAFHKIEELYVKEMAPLIGRSEFLVKREIRERVDKAEGCRPSWSALDARKEIERIKG